MSTINEFLSLDYLILGIALSKGLIGDLFKRNGFNITAFQKTMQELAQKEAKIFLDSNQVGMGLTLGTNYKTQ